MEPASHLSQHIARLFVVVGTLLFVLTLCSGPFVALAVSSVRPLGQPIDPARALPNSTAPLVRLGIAFIIGTALLVGYYYLAYAVAIQRRIALLIWSSTVVYHTIGLFVLLPVLSVLTDVAFLVGAALVIWLAAGLILAVVALWMPYRLQQAKT